MIIKYNTTVTATQFDAFGTQRELLRELHPCPIEYNNFKLKESKQSAVELPNGDWVITTELIIDSNESDIDLT